MSEMTVIPIPTVVTIARNTTPEEMFPRGKKNCKDHGAFRRLIPKTERSKIKLETALPTTSTLNPVIKALR